MEHTKQLAQILHLPGGSGTGGVTLDGPADFNTSITSLGALIGILIPYFFVFSGIGLLIMLIMGGFSLLTGGSDPKKIESGKQRITYAIVGFLIVFLAYWAVQLVAIMFNICEFKMVFISGSQGCQ